MIDIDNIFRYKIPDWDALIANGFAYSGGAYVKNVPIMRKQFIAQISVTDAGTVHFKVYEAETSEEYALVHVSDAGGGFISDVRRACEKALVDISNSCFRTELLKAEQTKRIIAFMKEHYAVEPEFLWEKYPNFAAFRIKENGKWFAVIMTVDRTKIGLSGHGNIEIINLKDIPENIEQRMEGNRFFRAYHMNKKHWYTICLDGRIPDEEVCGLIHISYELASGKNR